MFKKIRYESQILALNLENYKRSDLVVLKKKFANLCKENFGRRVKIRVTDHGPYWKIPEYQEVGVEFYYLPKYHLFIKTIIDLIGGQWIYSHSDEIPAVGKIYCAENALWSKYVTDENAIILSNVVWANIWEWYYAYKTSRELIPIPLLKKGLRDPEVPAKTLDFPRVGQED